MGVCLKLSGKTPRILEYRQFTAIITPHVRGKTGVCRSWLKRNEIQGTSAGRGWSASRSPGGARSMLRGFAQSGSSPGHPIVNWRAAVEGQLLFDPSGGGQQMAV